MSNIISTFQAVVGVPCRLKMLSIFSTFDNMLKLTISPQAKCAETDPRQGTPARARFEPPPDGSWAIHCATVVQHFIWYGVAGVIRHKFTTALGTHRRAVIVASSCAAQRPRILTMLAHLQPPVNCLPMLMHTLSSLVRVSRAGLGMFFCVLSSLVVVVVVVVVILLSFLVLLSL